MEFSNIVTKDGVKLNIALQQEQILLLIFGLSLALVFGVTIGNLLANAIIKK